MPKLTLALILVIISLVVTACKSSVEVKTATPSPAAPVVSYQDIISGTSGLIGHWNMENNWLDTKGNNNGAAENGVVFSTGILGGVGGDFSPATNTRIALPSILLADGVVTQFTIEAWVKARSLRSWGTIFTIVDPNQDDQLCFVVSTGPNLKMYAPSGNPSNIGSAETVPINLNEFYHVAVTNNGSEYKFYLNGALSHTATSNVQPTIAQTQLAYIGGSTDGWGETFDGIIDEVALYNRPLTAEEIATRYNAGK